MALVLVLEPGEVEKCHEGNLKIHLCFEISPAGPGRWKLANNCGVRKKKVKKRIHRKSEKACWEIGESGKWKMRMTR